MLRFSKLASSHHCCRRFINTTTTNITTTTISRSPSISSITANTTSATAFSLSQFRTTTTPSSSSSSSSSSASSSSSSSASSASALHHHCRYYSSNAADPKNQNLKHDNNNDDDQQFQYHSKKKSRTTSQMFDDVAAQVKHSVYHPETYGPQDDLYFYSKSRFSPFSWTGSLLSLLLFGTLCGASLWYYYYKREKQSSNVLVDVETFGTPNIGGEFQLTDTKGNIVTDRTLLGKWWLLYFGFTNCPDVCPVEMDKITKVVQAVDKKVPGKSLLPVFVSVDPARDTLPAIQEYLQDFHPRFLGLTGQPDQIKAMCRKYRVYYSEPEKHGENDYLVDHSIITYLVNPEGKFVQLYGKNFTPEELTESVLKHMKSFALGRDTSQLKRK